MYVVVAYDVVDNRRRNRIFKVLKNYGRHVQFSLFECDLRSEDFRQLRLRLGRLIDLDEDSLRFYFLDRVAVSRIEQMGSGHGRDLTQAGAFLMF